MQGFIPPVFAWVPSIAASNLISIDDGAFERWQGDLVVGSLAGKALYRIHLDQQRPVFVEPVAPGERIRDLAMDRRGRIILWTDDGRIGVLEPQAENPP